MRSQETHIHLSSRRGLVSSPPVHEEKDKSTDNMNFTTIEPPLRRRARSHGACPCRACHTNLRASSNSAPLTALSRGAGRRPRPRPHTPQAGSQRWKGSELRRA